MAVVVDASVVVAALTETGPVGAWGEGLLEHARLAAPQVMLVEAVAVLRRAALAGDMVDESASLAYADLKSLRVEPSPTGAWSTRIWKLRRNVTPHDAWYVAVAESLDVQLATLGLRLTLAPGLRCSMIVPP